MTNISYKVSYKAGYGTVVNSYESKKEAYEHAIQHEGSFIDKVQEERVWTYEDYIVDRVNDYLIDALSNLSSKDMENVINKTRERRYENDYRKIISTALETNKKGSIK